MNNKVEQNEKIITSIIEIFEKHHFSINESKEILDSIWLKLGEQKVYIPSTGWVDANNFIK